MGRSVNCPACGCDVTDRVRDAQTVRIAKRLNRQHLLRVAKILVAAEDLFAAEPRRLSTGPLWKADVRAIRYVFNALMASRGAIRDAGDGSSS